MASVKITPERQDGKLVGYHLKATVPGVSDRVDRYIARLASQQWHVKACTVFAQGTGS
jgi:hypothetical protein